MKRITGISLFLLVLSMNMMAQDQSLKKHYEAFYTQMKAQGDVQGVINSLTHLNILDPSVARQDTLAYVYMSEGKYMQALNTIGIENKATDSNLAIEVKAFSLKSVGQTQKAITHFEALFSRSKDVTVAYELAELYLQHQQLTQAATHVDYGLEHVKDDIFRVYYETQQPYRVPIKAGFLYLKALVVFNQDKTANIDQAITLLEEALKVAPNFNLAHISKNALESQKPEENTEENKTKK